MRSAALLLLLSAATLTAHATTFDTITFSFAGVSLPSKYPGLPPITVSGVDFTATLPSSPTPVSAPFGPPPAAGFFYNTSGLPFSEQPPGAPGTTFFFSPGAVSFVPTSDVNLPRAYSYFSLLSAASLYAGPDSAPSLLTGVYQADYLFNVPGVFSAALPGTITIAPVAPPPTAVPEPTSLTLAATGLLALLSAGSLRTRAQPQEH